MARHFENWLYAFRDWTLPRCEAPESFVIWSGLFTLASVVKDHVVFPQRLMGSYKIVPNLYVMLVGPAGGPRKSTTIAYAETLLSNSEGKVLVSHTGTSDSKFIDTLHCSLDGTISIISSEFAEFVKTSEVGMFSLLTDLFDNKEMYSYATRAHQVEEVVHPVVNLLAGTTPEWIATQAPEHLSGGGFSSRVLFIFESRVRRRQLYYELDWLYYEQTRVKLQEDLQHIMQLGGEFRHQSSEVKDAMENWYRESADRYVGDERVQGYLNRRHVHVHKVAMLLSLAESDELVVTLPHFYAAINLLEAAERNMPRALSNVGRNPYSRNLEDVLEFVREKGDWVKRQDIFGRFYHALTTDDLKEVLASLTQLGAVETTNNSGNILYKAKGKLDQLTRSLEGLARSCPSGEESESQAL